MGGYMIHNNYEQSSGCILRNVSHFAIGILSLVAMLGFTSSAFATLIYSAAVGGAPTGASYENFDNFPLGNIEGTAGGITLSFMGNGRVVTGSIAGQYAAPWISGSNGINFGNSPGADTTNYLSAGKGAVVLDFGAEQKYMGLLWGSVDSHNVLNFYNETEQLIGTITGANITATASGNQGVNGTYYVNINSDVGFRYVVASSSMNAFEFDNVAFNPEQLIENLAVPEPSTYAILASSLLLVLFVRQKGKVTAE